MLADLLKKCLKEQKEILEQQGYSVAYICVYGSQNYGLDIYTDTYMSDIDMKAIIVPTLDDLIKNSKPISTTVDTKWGGQCDLKDIRIYFETLLKANPAYIETLFTKYYIVDERFVNEFEQIHAMKDELVDVLSAQFIRSMYGMMCEKEKALCHPYPSIAHKIEKWGWDGKQLSHAYRLWLLMNDYFKQNKPLEDCLFPHSSEVEFLTDLKTNNTPSTAEEAKCLMRKTVQQAKELKDDIMNEIDESKKDYSIKNLFIELSQSIIRNKIIEECNKV